MITLAVAHVIFVTVCLDYDYGLNCSSKCGKCKDDSVCNHVDGSCPNDCSGEYTGSGDKCSQGIRNLLMLYVGFFVQNSEVDSPCD